MISYRQSDWGDYRDDQRPRMTVLFGVHRNDDEGLPQREYDWEVREYPPSGNDNNYYEATTWVEKRLLGGDSGLFIENQPAEDFIIAVVDRAEAEGRKNGLDPKINVPQDSEEYFKTISGGEHNVLVEVSILAPDNL